MGRREGERDGSRHWKGFEDGTGSRGMMLTPLTGTPAVGTDTRLSAPARVVGSFLNLSCVCILGLQWK